MKTIDRIYFALTRKQGRRAKKTPDCCNSREHNNQKWK